MAWLREQKLPHATVIQAIQLYERAKSEEAIEGLGITEAKEKFGIVKPKVNSAPAPKPWPGRSPLLDSPAESADVTKG